MSRAAPAAGRRGFTLVELVVSITVLAIIGAGIAKLMLTQGRAFEGERERMAAREVSRGAMNVMFSELRMVDANGGVVAASKDSVTLRVPYAMGIVCAVGSPPAVALFPTDSAMFASAAFSGYAYRDSASGVWQYVENSASVSSGTATPCTVAGFTMPAGSRYVNLAPVLPASATVGTPVMLVQRITYAFKPSVILPGRQSLWRTVVASGLSEEVAMPFDTSRAFRFFSLESDTSQGTVPSPLSNIRGLEINLAGQSERTARGETKPATEPLVSAVFFTNRP